MDPGLYSGSPGFNLGPEARYSEVLRGSSEPLLSNDVIIA
jgi:hypothetical protein